MWINVVSGAHMPKMDAFLGTCDPYCIVRCGDKDMRTGTGKGYDVRWDATFDVDVGGKGEVEVEVWDYDRLTKDDVIGKVWVHLCAYICVCMYVGRYV
jgi:hypothetical protein